MFRKAALIGTVLAVVLGTSTAMAEITSIGGFTQVEITEYYDGAPRDTDRVTESLPGTASAFPLQVVAHLVSSDYLAGDSSEEAAAMAAAQFADPRTLAQANPEEFAINLALNSVTSLISYDTHAVTRETRGVRFTATELGALANPDGTVDVTGRLFLDGALTILAADSAKDLTGAEVTLIVTVVQRVEGQSEQTVFSGEVALIGSTDGTATVAAGGDFPTSQLVLTDLSLTSTDFAAFHALIIPNITIDYSYTAPLDEEFTLEATVEVEAANVAGESGVAAVIGTPTDTLAQVIGLIQGDAVAAKTIAALESERDDPSGEPAFPGSANLLPAFPLCGLFGFESLIGVGALVGWTRFSPSRRHYRK